MLTFFFIYLLCGVLTGFLAGLFGIGGGLLVIPVLLFLFGLQLMPETMHMAIGTSLASIIVASLSSIIAQYKRGAILFSVVKTSAPGAVLGSFLGVLIASHLHGLLLQRLFGLLLLVAALNLLFNINSASRKSPPDGKIFFAAAILFGTLSTMLGVGGGIFMVPFFQWCGFSIRNSIATTAACILPVALVGTVGNILTGMHIADLPSFSTGFIYWPAFLGISLPSAFFAPLGVKAAHALPTSVLKKLFALFLILVALKMLI